MLYKKKNKNKQRLYKDCIHTCKANRRDGTVFLVVCADIKLNLVIPGMKCIMTESS